MDVASPDSYLRHIDGSAIGRRGETPARRRALILEADRNVIETVKWMGTPVWSHHGIICTGEANAKVLKLTFARSASLADPKRLFNSSLEGSVRRAIDFRDGESIDAGAFKALVRAAIAPSAKASRKKRLGGAAPGNGTIAARDSVLADQRRSDRSVPGESFGL